MSNEILTTEQARKFLGISKSYLYRLTCEKRIKFSKPGRGKLYFKKSDLETYLIGKLGDADFLSLSQASAVTGLAEKTITLLSEQDLIPNWKRNSELFFQRGELLIWLEEYRKRGILK